MSHGQGKADIWLRRKNKLDCIKLRTIRPDYSEVPTLEFYWARRLDGETQALSPKM